MAGSTIFLNESESYGGRLAAKIEWSATAYSSTNSSNVTASIYVRKYDPGMTLTVPTTGTWSFNLNINGNNITGTQYASVLLDWVFIGTHTVSSIGHNSDGSKSITISGSVSGPSGTGFAGHTTKGSGTATFDWIPRQATITAAYDFTDVDNPSFSFSNPGGFLMDVWLEPNPIGDHLCVRTGIPNTGSYTWVLTDAEREALRNQCAGPSCTIRIGLYSYVSGVQYADYRDKTYIMTENTATKPVVSLSVTNNNGSLPKEFDGLYIQGKSRVDVVVSASGKYNARIKGYSGKVDGKAYHSDKFTSDVLQNPGNVTIYGYATDTREFTGSKEQQVQVIEYSKPLVVPVGSENAILCYRSDGNGKRTGTSTSVWIKAARSYHKVVASGSQKNFCALEWRRKLSTEEWNDDDHKWVPLIEKSNLSTDEYSALLSGVEFDLQKSYTVQIRAIDDIGEVDPKTLEVPTRDVALHLGKGGKNVSIGSYCDYAEDYTFHSEWKAIFDKEVFIGDQQIANHVVEHGTDGIWTYRKWADGTAECRGICVQENVAVSTSWGSLFESTGFAENLPSGLFVDTPQFSITLDSTLGCMLEVFSPGSNTTTPHVCAVRPYEATIGTLKISFVAYGRWK